MSDFVTSGIIRDKVIENIPTTEPLDQSLWLNGSVMNVGPGLTIDTPIGIGGPAYDDPGLDRIKITCWGPYGGNGHCAFNLRTTEIGTDVNAYGALFVWHSGAYNGTPGYAHWMQVYSGNGAEGSIVGCNTPQRYTRFEIGPTWPESEVGRIRGVGDNKADWVIGWTVERVITAVQSNDTVISSVGSFTNADVGKFICWGTNTSGKNADICKITTYTDPTHVKVDTSRPAGIASQQARICTPRLIMDSDGGLVVSGAVGIGGPKYENANRWPLILYGTSGSNGYVASFHTTDTTKTNGVPNLATLLGTYVYSTSYTGTGMKGWAEQVIVQGLRGLSTGSLIVSTDWRLVLGPTHPDNEVLRAHYRGTNQADFSFNPIFVRNMTASQTNTTVTATVGTFSKDDIGRYVNWTSLGEMYRITNYLSSTQVTVDRDVGVGGIASTSMKVYRAAAGIDADGTFKSKNTSPSGGVHTLARVDSFSVYRTAPYTNVGPVALNANQLYKTPIHIPHRMTITEIAVSVSTAGAVGSLIRLGIRKFDTVTGEFTTLVADCGTVNADSTGKKSITGLNIDLPPGVYALELVSNDAPSLAGSSTGASTGMMFGANFTSASTVYPIGYVRRTFAFAALPADETGTSNETRTINGMPIIGIR